MTEGNAKKGSIYPAEVEKLCRRRVSVYTRADLHAKVYLFGRRAVVCSANLTRNPERLDEAGVLVRDPQTVNLVREWFGNRLSEPLTPEWAAHCKKVYRPPQGGGARLNERGRRRDQSDLDGCWLLGVHSTDFPSEERKAREDGYRVARRRVSNPRSYAIEEIRWAGNSRFLRVAHRGDSLIQVWDQGGSVKKVCPHGKLLNTKPTKSKTGAPVTYLYLEVPRRYRTIAWERFRRLCEGIGLKLGEGVGSREIRDRIAANEIKKLTSPERLGMGRR